MTLTVVKIQLLNLPILSVLMGGRCISLEFSPLLDAFPILSTACTSFNATGCNHTHHTDRIIHTYRTDSHNYTYSTDSRNQTYSMDNHSHSYNTDHHVTTTVQPTFYVITIFTTHMITLQPQLQQIIILQPQLQHTSLRYNHSYNTGHHVTTSYKTDHHVTTTVTAQIIAFPPQLEHRSSRSNHTKSPISNPATAQRKQENREGGGGRERDLTEKTHNSELYYSRIEILSICLFLQSVLANLQANTYTTTVRTLTTIITMMKMTMIIYW